MVGVPPGRIQVQHDYNMPAQVPGQLLDGPVKGKVEKMPAARLQAAFEERPRFCRSARVDR